MENNRYREITKSDWYGSIAVLLVFIAAITVSSFLLLPGHWLLWILGVAGGTALLVGWDTKNFAYRRPNCGEVFEISFFTNVISLNNINKKYLRCPKCGKRSWAGIMKIRK